MPLPDDRTVFDRHVFFCIEKTSNRFLEPLFGYQTINIISINIPFHICMLVCYKIKIKVYCYYITDLDEAFLWPTEIMNNRNSPKLRAVSLYSFPWRSTITDSSSSDSKTASETLDEYSLSRTLKLLTRINVHAANNKNWRWWWPVLQYFRAWLKQINAIGKKSHSSSHVWKGIDAI